MEEHNAYKRGFVPYGLGAFLVGIVGGFSTMLGPAFVQDLGIPYQNTTWTALAQAVSTAACAPILGKLGDVLGRKITLLTGIGVFTLGNILSALANSLFFMLIARFVVGIGTAAMTPVIMAYIIAEFPPQETGKGFSLYMLISSASVILGPTLGGLMVASFGWRRMIWVCTAICAAVFVGCLVTGDSARIQRRALGPFDGWGAVGVLLFFGLTLCVPALGQNFGWSSRPFLMAVVGALVALLGLLWAERRAKSPILPGAFLRRRAFILSVLALFLTQGLMQANMTNTIVFVSYTQPDNSAISGWAISVMYLGMSLGAVIFGPMADRFEAKSVLTGSLMLTAVGCSLLYFFSENTSLLLLMAFLGLLGLGLGGNGTILMKVALWNLSPQTAGSATGAYGLFRDLAAPFGVAVFVPLFTNQISTLMEGALPPAQAALQAARTLAGAELVSVALGLLTVQFLPKIRREKGTTT